MNDIIQIPRAGLAGEYKIVARKADGSERLLADWFENNIVEVGLDNLINTGWKQWCHAGTGTAAPTDTDTSLQTPIISTSAITNIVQSNSGSPLWYSQSSCDYVFAVGAGTYTEVGVANASHSGAHILFSRALIVDGLGAPTAITTLADEYLVVTYRLRMYPNLVDQVGTIGVGSDTHTYTIRPAAVNSTGIWSDTLNGAGTSFDLAYSSYWLRCQFHSSGLNPVNSVPAGLLGFFNANTLPYVPGSRQYLGDCVAAFSEVNSAGQISSIAFRTDRPSGNDLGWGFYQIGFDPVIPKNSGIQLTFTVGMGWGRYVAP